MGDISTTEKKLHWHLQGNWAPIEKELTEYDLQVKGEIPKDLSGLFVRNGFNPVSGSVSYTHLTLPTKSIV